MSGGDKYDAFLSYARVDNEAGDVSKFHKALQWELRTLWKRDCKIFFDSDINPGKNWRAILEQHLNEVNFMVCMLSRSFFESAECRKEVETFSARVRSTGLEPKIFPVILQGLARVDKDDFYIKILANQHVDFTSIKLELPDSKPFRKFISTLAHAILEDVDTPRLAGKSLEELRQELEKSEGLRRELEVRVEELKKEVVRLEGELAGFIAERDQFSLERVKLQEEVNYLQTQLASAKRELATIQKVPAVVVPGANAFYDPIALASGVEMIAVPGGPFLMGSDSDHDDEKPKRTVTLSPYRLSKTLITVAQFRAYTDAAKVKFDWEGRKPSWDWIDDHPMVRVTWDEARAYCNWAGGDLPTEAQWDRAARGTDGRTYPWGNEWKPELSVNSVGGSRTSTAPVNRRDNIYATALGHTDMAGNVWQWCRDWYSDAGYNALPDKDPQGVQNGTRRVLRGGSWDNYIPGFFRSSFRGNYNPTYEDTIVGFRLSGL